MDTSFHIDKFQQAVGQFDKKLLREKQMEVAVVEVLECVVIKMYKRPWVNPNTNPLTAKTRIFFSIWMGDSSLEQQKIFYNIHAFKLRQLEGYKIESRKFADSFRKSFKQFEEKWPNVGTHFGPLTLMEGWIKLDLENLQEDILKLANNFLEIEYLIGDTLLKFKQGYKN